MALGVREARVREVVVGRPRRGVRTPGLRRHPGVDRTSAGQSFWFFFRSQPTVMALSSEPSGFCALYSTWILLKLSDTWSIGTTPDASDPPVWNDETKTSSKANVRKSCC